MKPDEPIKVIELRNYLIKPGLRDEFAGYFRRHFVESQNALGGVVLGAFTVENEPDRFFWIRGFSDMASRSGFLPRFYGGEVWKKFGGEANAMMLEWHNVYLLKPVGEITAKDFSPKDRLLVIDFYCALSEAAGKPTDLPASKSAANSSVWISEMSENDFPRLPVIQKENLRAALAGYESRDAFEAENVALKPAIGKFWKKRERLVLRAAF